MGFIEGDYDIPGPKNQVTPIPPGEEDNGMSAADYNIVRNALNDLRTAAAAGGGSGSVACSVSNANTGSTSINVSTVGLIDWLAFGDASSGNRLETWSGASTWQMKKDGPGWLRNIELVFGGINLNWFNQACDLTIQTTAAASCAIAGLNSNNGWGLHTPGSLGATGYGYTFSVPVIGDGVSRTLRWYGADFSADTTITATLSDGTTHSATNVGTAGVGRSYALDVVYSSSFTQWMTVTVLVSTNHQTGAHIKALAAAIF